MSEYRYTLNSTKDYHTNRLSTLGWELTVCNALYPAGTPLRKVVQRNDSFGHLLHDYLARFVSMEKVRRIIEIGGGYGYLMKDFLDRKGELEPCMLDLSSLLLEKQKEALKGHEVSYREEDFLETDTATLEGFDLAIMNENLGDFPTLLDINADLLAPSSVTGDACLKRAVALCEQYGLDIPAGGRFHFNLGAIEALEKLCAARIPCIYVGEHSCEATVPVDLHHLLRIESRGSPERISLMGHDEYTIQFSHLEKVARAFGYTVIRGPFADFVELNVTDELRRTLASGGRFRDEDEAVCQFVEDLFKYEYLILLRQHSVKPQQ
jgi:hypothetical protein